MAEDSGLDEVLLKIRTVLEDAGLKQTEQGAKKAATAVGQIGKQADFASKLGDRMTRSFGAVAVAFMAIRAAATFVTSAISESLQASEEFGPQIEKAKEEWGKFKSFIGDTIVDFLKTIGILDHIGEIVTFIANAFHNVFVATQWVAKILIGTVTKALEKILSFVGKFTDKFKDAEAILREMSDITIEQAVATADKFKWDEKILANQKDNAKILKERKELQDKIKAEAKALAEFEAKSNQQREKEIKKLQLAANERGIAFRHEIANERDMDIAATAVKMEREKELSDAIMGIRQAALEEDLEAARIAAENGTELQKEEYIKQKNDYAVFLAEKDILNNEYKEKEIAINKELGNAAKKLYALLKFYNSQKVQDFQEGIGEITALQQSNNKKMQALGKAAGMAEIAVHTPVGALKAYQAMAGIPIVGPVLGAIAAAAVIAYGAERMAEVAGVQLAKGGIVPAVTGGVAATIGEGRSAEAVLPLDQLMYRRLGEGVAQAMNNEGAKDINLVVNIATTATDISAITDAVRNGTIEGLELANIMTKQGLRNRRFAV